jgi:hypothetical protein
MEGYWVQATCKNCGKPIHHFVSTVSGRVHDWSHMQGGAFCIATTWAEPTDG